MYWLLHTKYSIPFSHHRNVCLYVYMCVALTTHISLVWNNYFAVCLQPNDKKLRESLFKCRVESLGLLPALSEHFWGEVHLKAFPPSVRRPWCMRSPASRAPVWRLTLMFSAFVRARRASRQAVLMWTARISSLWVL